MSEIFNLGNQILLDKGMRASEFMEELSQFDDNWSPYNDFKPHIKREGLCIINESGLNQSGPALNSLIEWNTRFDTDYSEKDFDKTTPVYECTEIKNLLSEILHLCGRTHILRVPPGGYFPPHRDSRGEKEIDTFRLIMALSNTANPWFRFMLEDKPLHFEIGSLYAVNTTLEHTLFNASANDSYWLVINAHNTPEMHAWVRSNLAIK